MKILRLILRITVLIIFASSVQPVQARVSDARTASDVGDLDDPAEVESFVDRLVTRQLEERKIPGATVAIVKDGELLFAKGYGFADLEAQKPVIADQTLFHIGSITKLFTWTAVMQLVEQGKIDLNTDINQYLPDDLQIPATFLQPITMHHLLTHTAGFEDKLSILFAFEPDAVIPLKDYLKQNIPQRVYAPGEVIAYSNYGTSLAGFIIEYVSGEPYEQYIDSHILQPLGMSHTTLHMPAPGLLADDEAVGYGATLSNDVLPLQEYMLPIPAGGLLTTATDLSRFMIAHLQDGRYGNVRILNEGTAHEMHRQHYASDPALAGFTYGFMELNRNGQHLLWHSGGTALFNSILFLIPFEDVGAFVSYNGLGGGRARVEFRDAFLDHYFPIDVSQPQPLPDYSQRVSIYEGLYRESRFGFSSTDKIIYAFSWVRKASANPDGTLHYLDQDWIEVEPGVFHEVNGQGTLMFKADEMGKVWAIADSDPHEVQVRIAWYENPMLAMSAGGFALLTLCSSLVTYPSMKRRLKFSSEPRPARLARLLVMMIAGLYLIFLLWLMVGAGLMVMNNFIEIMGGMSKLLPIPLIFPLVAAVLTLGVLVCTILAWKENYWTLGGRVYFTVMTLAAIVFVWWLSYWNLLGWHLYAIVVRTIPA